MRALLAGLLASMPGLAAAHENVPGEPPVHPQISPAQAAFDTLFWDIDDGALPLNTREQTYATLARLERAIPPDDVHRRMQYRYMHCLIGFNHVASGGVEYARASVEAARAAGDGASEAGLRLCLGSQLLGTGETGAARAEFELAAQLGRTARDFNVEGLALVNRGHMRMDAGDMALGLQDLLVAQEVFERGHVQFQIEFNLFSIAQAYRRLGDRANALDYINQVLEFGRARNDELVLASALTERGRIHRDMRRFDAAEDDVRRSLLYSANANLLHNVGFAHMDLADIHNRAGRPRQALDEVEAAEKAFASVGDAPPPGLAELLTGVARSQLGQHRRALRVLDEALPALLAAGDVAGAMYLYLFRADSREALGDEAGALADLREYARLRDDTTASITNQRVLALSQGFDARYRELQNTRLRQEHQRAERLAAAERRRKPWRLASIGLGAALSLLLGWLAVRQARRTLSWHRLASTDPLTGAANRRDIRQAATLAMADAAAPMCVVLIDLDHFKRVNDAYGHAVGDQVLVRAVAAWNTVLRADDRLGRLGGEEFLAVLPGADAAAGTQVAGRILEATRAIDFADIAPGLRLTTSIGVATADGADRALQPLLERADAALYRAKAGGRDRIEIAPAPSTLEAAP